MLFAATLAGLACVVVVGLFMAPPAPPADAGESNPGSAAFGLAMVMVLLTYGGWNESAYISAEVRDGRRNMSRALVIGIALITLGYLAVNYAYLRVLGASGMAQSDAVAHDLMEAALGPAGATLLSALVVVVVLASLNVTILTGARTNYALGRDMPLLGALGQWSGRYGAPVTALLVQAGVALGLVLAGTMSRSGIEAVVDYLSPVFWLFFLLTGLSLFVLRWRDPERERPFRVPLYPVTPALFCASSAYLLWSSVNYTGSGAFAGVAVLLTGIPVLLIGRRSARYRRADHYPPPATSVADTPVPDKGD
ncbi:MAG: APC family permease [Acetobacterales bacterium]